MADIVSNGFHKIVDAAIHGSGAAGVQLAITSAAAAPYLGHIVSTAAFGPLVVTSAAVAAIHFARDLAQSAYANTLKKTVDDKVNANIINFTAQVIDVATIVGFSFAAASFAPVLLTGVSVNAIGLIALYYTGQHANNIIKPIIDNGINWVSTQAKNVTSKTPDPVTT